MSQAIDSMTYEEALQALDDLIEELNKGNLALQESVAAYEKGMALALHCQKQLTAAEGSLKKIEKELIVAFDLEEASDESEA